MKKYLEFVPFKLLPAVLFVSSLLALPAQAEDAKWKNDSAEIVALYQLGNFSKAANLAAQLLAYSERAFGAEHATTGITLLVLGVQHQAMGQYDKALPLFVRALAISEKDNGPEHLNTEASLNNLGLLHRAMGQYDKALPLFVRALAISEKVNGSEHHSAGTSLNNLGLLHQDMGQYEKALPLFVRALAMTEKAEGPEHPSTASSLNNIASLLQAMGQYEKALPLLTRALAISEKAEGAEHLNTGIRLNNLGLLRYDMGQYDKVLPLFVRALAISEKVNGPEHPSSGTGLNNLASLYQAMGQYAKALPLLTRALAVSEKASGPEHPSSGGQLNNLGLLHHNMGEYDKAQPLFIRALAISEKVNGPEHPSTGTGLNNLASLYQAMGQYAKALPLLTRALAVSEKASGPEHPSSGRQLNNLGLLHRAMGQHDKALPLFVRALAISESVHGPEHPSTGTALSNLAGLHRTMGQYGKALPLFVRALAISEKAEGFEHPSTGRQLNNLGSLYQDMGQYDKSLDFYVRALSISEKAEGPEHPNTGTHLNNLGLLHRAMGQYDKGLQYVQRAYLASLSNPSTLTTFDSASAMAWLSNSKGNKEEAILFAKQAVNSWQLVRSKNAAGLSQEQNRGLLEQNKRIYSDLAEWLISAGRLAEAEQVMAMLKNQELMDFVRRSGAGPAIAELDGRESQALSELQGLSKEWVKDARELASLEQKRSTERTADDSARLAVLVKRRVEWSNTLQRWLSNLPSSLAKVEKDGQVQRDQISKTSSVMQTLVAATPGDALGLQYVLTDKRLSIIFHTKSASTFKQVNVPLEDIRKQVARFREVLSEPSRDPQPAARELYQTLLGPIEAELSKVSPQTLILNLDDVLRYVPFAALHDGKRYLAERMAVAIHTSAGGASIRPQSGALWQVGGLGLSDAKGRFTALPSVGNELRAIVKTASNASGLLPGQIAMNADFHEDSLRDMLKDQLSVLHIATHFSFLPGSETGSFLLLGDGKELSLATIKNMNFTGVQLLTLSACETAKGGGRTDQGEEVEGLAAVVQQKGAQSVMASLWPVADASTALLMREFYQLRTKPNSQGNAQSLRAAQLGMLSGELKLPTTVDSNRPRAAQRVVSDTRGEREPAFVKDNARPFAHPYYWAPFIMMGNWL